MSSPNRASELTINNQQSFLPYVEKMVSKANLNIAQKDTNHPTTLKAAEATDLINVVETRAQTRQKLVTTPQTDLKAPKIHEEDKIVDPPDLPNEDQWPFTQQQIINAQKVDPMLDQTRQRVENQLFLVAYRFNFPVIPFFTHNKLKLFSLDMQSGADTSCGGMRCKCSYVDPIIPLITGPSKQTVISTTAGDIQDLFPTFAHDYQMVSSIAYNTHQIHEHLSDKAISDTDLDMYNIPANKLPFSSRATFYMWQEATKRYMCHIDQEAAGSHCSYQKINHNIVLRSDPFPPKF
uniref:Uncharacterized protein n=1 Tax=Romanomermis culicivorax TaxID=13658 RepID=A0A915K4D6_ROMCU